jgi:hypothetical protein
LIQCRCAGSPFEQRKTAAPIRVLAAAPLCRDADTLISGIIARSTNEVEHPELMAWRIAGFAIAGSDWALPQQLLDCALPFRDAMGDVGLLAQRHGWRSHGLGQGGAE